MAYSEVFMSNKRYTDECKMEAVSQVTDRGFKVADVAERLGVTTKAYTSGFASSANRHCAASGNRSKL